MVEHSYKMTDVYYTSGAWVKGLEYKTTDFIIDSENSSSSFNAHSSRPRPPAGLCSINFCLDNAFFDGSPRPYSGGSHL